MNDRNQKTEYTLTYLPETDSTNRVLLQLAKEGAPEGTAVAAEKQTAGIGRMGRPFFSPAGSGAYFSLLLRPDPKTFDAARITVTAAVAVAEAVERELGISLGVKWVNDLYYKNKKVCGILAQGITEGEAFCCVLGIGINVFAPAEGFGSLEAIAGALLETAPDAEQKDRLIAAVLDRFFALYRGDFSACIEEYRRRLFLTGKTVTLVRGTERLRATVRGVDDTGALLAETDGKITAFSSGEIALEDYR